MDPKTIQAIDLMTRATVSIALCFVAVFVVFNFAGINRINNWDVKPENVIIELQRLKHDMIPAEDHQRWRDELFRLNPELTRPFENSGNPSRPSKKQVDT